MKHIFLSLFVFCSVHLSGQETYQGTILDNETSEPLAYVNIGVIGKNVGTVSNFQGEFDLAIATELDADKLRISMVGYEKREFAVKDFKELLRDQKMIRLNKAIQEINEVVISGKALKEKTLGNKTQSKGMSGGFSSNELGNEAGVYIKVKKNRQSLLKEFNANINSNTYGSVKFRLNIYSVANGLPDKKILNENIFVETALESGNLSVDLRPYNIVTEGDFIVTLEWIEDLGEVGLFFSACLFCNDLVTRQTSQGSWEVHRFGGLGFNVLVSQ